MIVAGSMVALKGHHRFPMVVKTTGYNVPVSQYRRGEPDNEATVVWLGANGQPFEAAYPLEILEEIDG